MKENADKASNDSKTLPKKWQTIHQQIKTFYGKMITSGTDCFLLELLQLTDRPSSEEWSSKVGGRRFSKDQKERRLDNACKAKEQ